MAGEASEILDLKNLVVHVGLGQAGSTTLQRHVFNNPEFGFALLTPYEQRYNTVRKYLELPLPGDFDPGSCSRFFARRFLDFGNPELVPVISNEGLTGQNFLQMDHNLESELYARRILDAFGAAKILIIVREQNSLLLSKYRKLLERFEGNVTLKDFVRRKPHGQRVQIDSDSMYLGLFEYDKLVRMYASFFGPANVLALPLEMMEKDPDGLLHRLNAFCGSSVPRDFKIPKTNLNGARATSRFFRHYNVIYSPNCISLFWFLNPRTTRGRAWIRQKTLVGRTSNWLQSVLVNTLSRFSAMDEAILAERRMQREELSRIVGDFFADSNRRLADMLNLDLAKFGYVTERQNKDEPSRSEGA